MAYRINESILTRYFMARSEWVTRVSIRASTRWRVIDYITTGIEPT